jgi:hypothetical protein
MHRWSITYKDFNGDTNTEVFYFHLSKSELIKLNASYSGGAGNFFTRILETKNEGEVINEFEKFILAAYGQKSDDGKIFLKSDELRSRFVQSAAYDALFTELMESEKAQNEFIMGVMPKELQDEVQKAQAVQNMPPPPPEHQGRVTKPIEPQSTEDNK